MHESDDRASSEFSSEDSMWGLLNHSPTSEAVGDSSIVQQQHSGLSYKQANLPCMADELELCAGAIEEGQWDVHASGDSSCASYDTSGSAFLSPADSIAICSRGDEGSDAMSIKPGRLFTSQCGMSGAERDVSSAPIAWASRDLSRQWQCLSSSGQRLHDHVTNPGHTQLACEGSDHSAAAMPVSGHAPAGPMIHLEDLSSTQLLIQPFQLHRQRTHPLKADSVGHQRSSTKNLAALASISLNAKSNPESSRQAGEFSIEPSCLQQHDHRCSTYSLHPDVSSHSLVAAEQQDTMVPMKQHSLQPLLHPCQSKQHQSHQQHLGSTCFQVGSCNAAQKQQQQRVSRRLSAREAGNESPKISPPQSSRRGSARVAFRNRGKTAAAADSYCALSDDSLVSEDGDANSENCARAASASKRSVPLTGVVVSQPNNKIPRCASAPSIAVPASTGRASQPRVRATSAQTAAKTASSTMRKARGSSGRGTGPIAHTLPGQHCSNCGTQVTPVWRAGPNGPKTLCNACGVRYMKTVKPRR